jgi:hypothetical protein
MEPQKNIAIMDLLERDELLEKGKKYDHLQEQIEQVAKEKSIVIYKKEYQNNDGTYDEYTYKIDCETSDDEVIKSLNKDIGNQRDRIKYLNKRLDEYRNTVKDLNSLNEEAVQNMGNREIIYEKGKRKCIFWMTACFFIGYMISWFIYN